MKLGKYYLDFHHDVDDEYSQAFLYEDPRQEPIAEVTATLYYKDRFSRKQGRRACMAKLLHPAHGPFAGDAQRQFRAELWHTYWQHMPQDLHP